VPAAKLLPIYIYIYIISQIVPAAKLLPVPANVGLDVATSCVVQVVSLLLPLTASLSLSVAMFLFRVQVQLVYIFCSH
jgi:hypothetical protein